jgi:hypothetical protein
MDFKLAGTSAGILRKSLERFEKNGGSFLLLLVARVYSCRRISATHLKSLVIVS